MITWIGFTGFVMTFAGFLMLVLPWSNGNLTSEMIKDVFGLGVGSLPYGMTFGAVAFVSGLIIMLLAEILATLRRTLDIM